MMSSRETRLDTLGRTEANDWNGNLEGGKGFDDRRKGTRRTRIPQML